MSLSDCFGKMGDALHKGDVAAIQSYVDGGLSEMEAIDLHLSTMGDTTEVAEPPVDTSGSPTLDVANKLATDNKYANNRELKTDLQKMALQHMKDTGVDLTVDDEALAAHIMVDVVEALKGNSDAIGWYNETVGAAMAVLELMHPELATDSTSRFAFTYALANTSNGLKVDKNFELAEKAYRHWKETGEMPTDIGIGNASSAIDDTGALFNTLVKDLGYEEMIEMFDDVFTVKQLQLMGHGVSGENVDTVVRGAAVMGPKIGNGFYSNLRGYFDQLTMDRWFVRTWGRHTATLIEHRPDMVRAKTAELKDLSDRLRKASKVVKEWKAIGVNLNERSMKKLSAQILKSSMLPDNRDVMNRTVTGGDVRKTGNSLSKYIDGQKEDPANGTERNRMRLVLGIVLEEAQKTNPDLTMSDLQALLWYGEKRLYDKARSAEDVADGYVDEDAPDYANAAMTLARSFGISENAIKEAEENGRARGTRQGAARDGQAVDDESGEATRTARKKRRTYLGDKIYVPNRPTGKSDDKTSSFKRAGTRTDREVRGIVRVYTPKKSYTTLLDASEMGHTELHELVPERADEFTAAIDQSKSDSEFGAAVYVYTTEEYKDMRLFISPDGKDGFAIKPDGDIVSVFSSGGNKVYGMLALAIEEGGTKLDAFDTVLPDIYEVAGFREVNRDAWSDEYAPDGWDKGTFSEFNEGEPDVVYMEYVGPQPEVLHQQDRATIELKENGERVIRLSNASDPSSFLHESAHLFLELEKQLAAEFGIHEEQQAVLDWLGVESFDDVTVDMHEKYAETFEKYLETGKAPSHALRDAFAAFRRWIVAVYRSMDPRTRANLTPEITEYFNRMLATDAEIAAMQGDATAMELFQSAEQAGMTDSQWEKYQEQKAKRDSVATATLDAKLISELKSRYTEEWNDEKRPLVEEAKEDLRKQPAYAILADAASAPMNHAAVAELNGGKIPGNMIGKATKDGIDPAEYAEVYGYPSAAAMIKDLAATPKLSEAADQAAEEIMIARHGDILNDGTIEREARDAMHNDEQIKLLLMELKALRPGRADKINREYLKSEAKRMLGGMKYADIQPSKFYRAELRAAKRAAEAKTDEEKYAAKTQQAANHYLYRESVLTKAAMDRHRKYARRVQTRAYNTNQVDARYVQNMKAIANMYDLRSNTEKVMVVSQVLEWYNAQINDANQYVDVALLDMNLLRALELKTETGEIPADFTIPTFDDLTAEDMRGLYDQLRHLRFIGGQMSDEVKAENAAKRLALSESIIENGGNDVESADDRGLPTITTDLKRNISHMINKIPSLRNLVRMMDGFDENGAAARMIFMLVEKGNSNKLNLQTEFYERYDSAMDDIHTVGLSKAASDKKVYIKEDGGAIAMHSENRFMLALYWGTESSREAIRQGWGLTDADVAKILSDLTPQQLELVNTTWAVNETLWPQLSEASVKQYGVAPPKLDPTPFVVNGVTMTGGHQRLFYDSSSIELQSEKELAGSQSDIMPTKAGSLHSRVGSGGKPPLLDRNNIARAVDDSIHFIAFSEVGAELRALMNGPDVKAAIERKHGLGFYKALIEDIDSVTGNRRGRETIPMLGKAMSHLRQAATFRHLAYSVRNVVQQGTSIPIAMQEVGTARFSSAVVRFMSPGREALRDSIREKSAFMSNRASLINREASEVAKRMAINSRRGKAWRFAADNVFFFQTLVDAEVAFPTWLAKYEAEMEDHGDERRAVSAADTSVAESVGSGSDLHLGGAFHSTQNELTRTFTLFGSWFNAYYQRIYKSTHGGNLSEADLMDMFTTVFTMPIIVGVLSAAMIADGPGDDPDAEDWALWVGKQYLAFLAGTVPLLRDVASSFKGFAPSTVWSAGGESPSKAINEVISYVEGNESGLKFTSDMLKIAATLLPIPGAGNFTRVMDYTDSYLQGDEGDIFNPYQALVEGADKN